MRMRGRGDAALGWALALAVAACGQGGDAPADGGGAGDPGAGGGEPAGAGGAPGAAAGDPSVAGGAPTPSGYVATAVTDGGTVAGRILFTGEVPSPTTVQGTTDAEACGSSIEVSAALVGPGGGLADAVVSLVDVREGAAFTPATPPALDQAGCRFTPHVVVVPTGGTLRVLNSDPVPHNVHTVTFDNPSLNRTQLPGTEAIELTFDAPERVRIRCDLHGWMSAWIVVSDHPYVAVTDASGAFTLPNVPPGSYALEIWHETLGTRSAVVTVEAGGTAEVTVDLDAGS